MESHGFKLPPWSSYFLGQVSFSESQFPRLSNSDKCRLEATTHMKPLAHRHQATRGQVYHPWASDQGSWEIVHWLVTLMNLIKKILPTKMCGEEERTETLAGGWVPNGFRAWDAGHRNPVPRFGVNRAGDPGEKVRWESVRKEHTVDSRDKRSCPRLGFCFCFLLLFLFLY